MSKPTTALIFLLAAALFVFLLKAQERYELMQGYKSQRSRRAADVPGNDGHA